MATDLLWLFNGVHLFMAYYFGFSFSLAMLPKGKVVVCKKDLSLDQVKKILGRTAVKVAANPCHKETFELLERRFGIVIKIPAAAPRISMRNGDCMLVAQIVGLPRLENRRQYAEEEIANAIIKFMEIKIFLE